MAQVNPGGGGNEVEDGALVVRAQQGDERAFGRLVDRYRQAVHAAALAVTQDFDAAHDIAQEVFLRAWFGLG
ncbi:MAG: sigma factor, partial [Candidatus Latescibacterota bacterium]